MVHISRMKPANKTVRQNVTLPGRVIAQVRASAKVRRLAINRMLGELIGKGIEAKQSKHKQVFFELAKRFRRLPNLRIFFFAEESVHEARLGR